jgi:hypothetical protein
MENRTYTVALAMVFALIAVVTCLIVLVVLLMATRESGPMLALPAPSFPETPTLAPTDKIDIALEPSLVVPTAAAPTPAVSMSTQSVFLSMPLEPTAELVLPAATPSPKTLRVAATPKPQGPTPTPTLPGNFQFMPDGGVKPDTKRACTGAAIFGYFHDAAGQPLAGIRVRVYNEYLKDNNISAPSKPAGAPDAGFYDFLISPKPSLWNVVVVDAGGSPLSPEVQVIRPSGAEVCYFQVDWKATR